MKMIVLSFIQFVFIFLSISLCECKQYRNYTLFRGIPVKESHLKFFNELDKHYEVNFWRSPAHLHNATEFTINPNDKEKFLRSAENEGILLTTIMDDVQRAFDEQKVEQYIQRRTDTYNWHTYYRVHDIYLWLDDLAKEYPKELKIFNIGYSAEKRPIKGAKIVLKDAQVRSKVIVEGGIHAREWISPAFVTYFLNHILTAKNSKNKNLRNIALSHEWYFIPVLNPDGYEFTHSSDRLWRKNRRRYSRGIGVDLNRNFGIAFNTVGVSDQPSSETYCGPSAFSEPETLAMSKFIRSKGDNLEYYLAFHAYGQYMIMPYTQSEEHVDNFDEVKGMCEKAAEEIYRHRGTKYTIGTAYDTVGYKTSGVSGCWTKMTLRVPYVVTFELNDNGRHGFALPPQEILPSCKETMDGIISLLQPKTAHFQKLAREATVPGVVERNGAEIRQISLCISVLLQFGLVAVLK